MANFSRLRAANAARNIEWALPGSTELLLTLSLSFRGNELGGEMGEVADVLMMSVGTEGPNLDNLADELADVVICADLCAMTMDQDLPIEYDMVTDEMDGHGFLGLARAVGFVCNGIKKLERESIGLKGSYTTPAAVVENLKEVVLWCYVLADDHKIDLDVAVVNKFNKTSNKVGLTTRLILGTEL